MTLELDSNVVYAILAAIVAIVLIVNITRIVLRRPQRVVEEYKPYDQAATEPKQPWVSREGER